MSSIIRGEGFTFHGISIFGRGVFTYQNGFGGYTYAGQHRGGYACGLGVATWPCRSKEYAEHGPDGKYDGRNFVRFANGDALCRLFERGMRKDCARVYANGRCTYNYVVCAPDDPRLLALTAQVAPVEVRPEAHSHHPPLARHSPSSNRPMDQPARFSPAGAREDHCDRGAPPLRMPAMVAVRHKQPRCKTRPTSEACTDRST